MKDGISFFNYDDIWENHSSYLIAEYLFFFIAFSVTVDAWFFQKEARFKALWLCCPIIGFITEFVMSFNQLDSRSYAQASVMLLDRQIPLYKVFVYFWVLYCPVAMTWHTNVDFLGGFVLSALTGSIIHSLFDIVGANHLWWEWHADDPIYASQFLYVPATSTMWVMMQLAGLFIAFHLINFVVAIRSVRNHIVVIFVAICASVLGLVIMIMLVALIFYPLVFIVGLTAQQFVVLEFIFKLGFLSNLIYSRQLKVLVPTLNLQTAIPAVVSLAVTISLMVLVLVTSTDKIRSKGSHQPFGMVEQQCSIKESCFLGYFERSHYLCDTSNLPFNICSKPEGSVREYITCGKSDGSVVMFSLSIGYLICNFIVLTLCLRKQETKPANKML